MAAPTTRPINPRTGEPITAESLNGMSVGRLPGLIGLTVTEFSVQERTVSARLPIRGELLAPNGYLHAASVVALADTICGYGSLAFRADGASGFTTIEMKSNFVGTARDGAIRSTARLLHGGRSTQVWEATRRERSRRVSDSLLSLHPDDAVSKALARVPRQAREA